MNQPAAVRPQRPSALVQMGIPQGFYYDIRTGLLKEVPTPPVTPDPTK